MPKTKKPHLIAVTGGKGGTGKSTVSILLAKELIDSSPIRDAYMRPLQKATSFPKKKNPRIILVDCDVECPNDYLLTGQKLTKPVKKVYAQFPELDKTKCQACGLCAQKCRSNAIFQAPGKYPVFIHELCSGCGLCWHICPHNAIKAKKKLIGEIFKNKVDRNLWLVTGQSVGVVDETGPIVTETKHYALGLAQKNNIDYILFDTAVGLHCGVIRALMDCDLAYAVTEPTPLGAHDLNLILKLLKILKVPAEIIVNQADLGNAGLIDKIAHESNTEITYRLPYSKKLAEAYSKGSLLESGLL